MPKRIRLSRARGWRLPAGAVNVARPGKWGNPFVVGTDGTREECVRYYALLLAGYMPFGVGPSVDLKQAFVRWVKAHIAELRGKDLACWCSLDKPCHADVLLRLANWRGKGKPRMRLETLLRSPRPLAPPRPLR